MILMFFVFRSFNKDQGSSVLTLVPH